MHVLMVTFTIVVAQPAGAQSCLDLADFAEFQNAMYGPDCEPDALIEMVLVPGGGAGPAYDFLIGKYEVTNSQFAAFLNDAQLAGAADYRGAFLVFHESGNVRLPSGTTIFAVSFSRLVYNPLASFGSRYQVAKGFEDHPAVAMTWVAAVKFCNWLTLHEGLQHTDRCYVEGSSSSDWRPIPSASNWHYSTNDLTTGDRESLVNDCRGFRLPMESVGQQNQYLSDEPTPFNEWYKAAAYDPAGPAGARIGTNAELIPSRHWAFSVGRDALIQVQDTQTPFGITPITFVGYFNGINWTGNPALPVTAESNNAHGLYDAGGNVREWLQDQACGGSGWRSVRGGWAPNSYRQCADSLSTAGDLGFRVLRVP